MITFCKNNHIIRLFATLLIIATCASAGYARRKAKPMDKYFGVRVSYEQNFNSDIDITNPWKGRSSIINSGKGASIGAIYHYTIPHTVLFVEPGLNIFYTRESFNPDFFIGRMSWYMPDFSKDPISVIHSRYTVKQNKVFNTGLRMPIHMGVQLGSRDFKVSLFTGPEFICGLSSKIRFTFRYDAWSENTGSEEYSDYKSFRKQAFTNNDYLKRWDIAWSAGLGLTLYRHYYIGANFSRGLLDTAGPSLGTNFHRSHLNVSLGLNF